MTDKYYLLSSKCGTYSTGTILNYEEKKKFDLSIKSKSKFDKSFQYPLIEISHGEGLYLLGKDRRARMKLKQEGIFDGLQKLNTDSKCYYLPDKPKLLCTIVSKKHENDHFYFNVKPEPVPEITVSINQMELFSNNVNSPRKDQLDITTDVPDLNESFKCDTYLELTENNYKMLKDSYHSKNTVNFFGNEEFLKWLNISFDKFISPSSTLYIKFISHGVKILCHIVLSSPEFAQTFIDDEMMTKNLINSFTKLSKQDTMSPKEKKLTNAVITIVWYIMKSGKKLEQSFTDYLRKCFNETKFIDHLKCGIALCLPHIIDQPCSQLDNVHRYLAGCYGSAKKDVYFTNDDIFIGLGKISVLPKAPNLSDNLKKIVEDIGTSLKSNEPFAKIQEHLRTLEPEERFEIDNLLDVTTEIIDKFGLKRVSAEDKAYNTCLNACLKFINTNCNEIIVTKINGNKDFFDALKGLLLTLVAKPKWTNSEEKLLTQIIIIYYNLLKYDVPLDDDLMGKLEHCYMACTSSKYTQIKLVSGLCLTFHYRVRSQKTHDLKLYLIKEYHQHSFKELNSLSKNDIIMALGNMNVKMDIPEPALLSKLDSSLKAITKCTKDDMFTKESQKNLEIISENLANLKEEFEKNVNIDEFCDAVQRFLSKFLNSIKTCSENLIIKNCVKIILDILCSLCDSGINIVKKIFGTYSLTLTLDNIFCKLIECNNYAAACEELGKPIILIYWSIVKSGFVISEPKLVRELEQYFDRYSSMKTASALCLSLIYDTRSDMTSRVESYLQTILKDDSSNGIVGFSQMDIYSGLGHISQIKKPVIPKITAMSLTDEENIVIDLDNKETLYDIINKRLATIPCDKSKIPTEESQNHLKFILENIQNLIDEFEQRLDTVLLIEVAESYLQRFLNVAFRESISMEDDVLFVSIEMIMNIIRELCDWNVRFVKRISENENLINTINGVFKKLVDKSSQSPIEKKLIAHIIIIYCSILQTESMPSTDLLPKEKIIKCFTASTVADTIEIATALCLALMYDHQCDTTCKVALYLRSLFENNPSGKINGFSRHDIWMSLGHIALLSPKIEQDRIGTDVLNSATEESVPAIESKDAYELDKKDYEKCLLPLSDRNTPLKYKDVISCIKIGIRMSDPKILSNIISSSVYKIDFQKSPDILQLIIGKNDPVALLALLNNCEAYTKDYSGLLELTRCRSCEIAEAVAKNIVKTDICCYTNIDILSSAFFFLKRDQYELFHTFYSKSTNPNAYLDDNDTFFTKMIRELNINQIEDAIGYTVFDMNKHTKNGESAICIACQEKDVGKANIVLSDRCIPKEDIKAAIRISYENDDDELVESLNEYSKLHFNQ